MTNKYTDEYRGEPSRRPDGYQYELMKSQFPQESYCIFCNELRGGCNSRMQFVRNIVLFAPDIIYCKHAAIG